MRLDYQKTAPAGIRALGGVHVYVDNSGLPKVLVNLVYLRCSRSTAAPTASTCIRAT